MELMSRLQTLLLSGFISFASQVAVGGDRIDLTPTNAAGQMSHVTIQLEAGGQNLIRPQQQTGQSQDDKTAANEQKQKISVAAKLTYDEKRLTADATAS